MVPRKVVPVKLDDASYGNSHAVSVLSICDIKRRSAAFYLTCEEREVYPIGCTRKDVSQTLPMSGSTFLSCSSVNADLVNPTE